MKIDELQTMTECNVDNARTKVFNFITQCIKDIENTVSDSGLTMRDIGFDVEKYMTARDSYIIELKLRV